MATEYKKTIKPAGQGGDYISLKAWQTAEVQDLVANDRYAVAEIDGDWTGIADTTPVNINGWTTDATHYIYIYTTASARHKGKWDNTKYRLEITASGSSQYAFLSNAKYLRVSGLQISMTSTYATTDVVYAGGGLSDSDNEMQFSHNIIKGIYTSSGTGDGLDTADRNSNARSKLWNNIIYDISGAGIKYRGYAYNNTVYNCNTGYIASGWYAKNNISYNNLDNYFGTFHALSNYNLSGPQQTDAPGVNSRNGPNMFVTFVDESNDDFHLAPSDTGARNYGTSLNPDPDGYLSFSDDIDGQTRPGQLVWDIGADENFGCLPINIVFEVL